MAYSYLHLTKALLLAGGSVTYGFSVVRIRIHVNGGGKAAYTSK